MATSHFCNGKWRDGPVADCPNHKKLSKKQSTVHRGVGEPGGSSGKKAPAKGGSGDSGSSSSGSAKPAAPSSSGSDSKKS
jgi:hypothetical protein